jgi:hypothetical protein
MVNKEIYGKTISNMYQIILQDDEVQALWRTTTSYVPGTSQEAQEKLKAMLVSKTLHARVKCYITDYKRSHKIGNTTDSNKQGTQQTLKAYEIVKANKKQDNNNKHARDSKC